MPAKRKPGYLLHKPTGQARVRIDGKDHYLGEYGTPESRDRYEELVRQWQLKQSVDQVAITVGELSLRCDEWARVYYRHPDGEPTGTDENIREAMRFVNRRYSTTRVRDFGPLKLKAVREAMIADGRCRSQINRMINQVKRVFSWGVENELVPPDVYSALRCVRPLAEGRTEAVESDPIEPAPVADILKTIEHLPTAVADMVRLHLLTGCRPGELFRLRPCDVDRTSDEVWTYRPHKHKTRHKDKDRTIYFGPQAQRILRPYLEADSESCCFSPAVTERIRSAERRSARKTPVQPSQQSRAKGRKLADRYSKDSYNRVIRRACERAGVARWTPQQVRHTFATETAAKHGRDAARVILGHADAKTTDIYAERDLTVARELMKQIG